METKFTKGPWEANDTDNKREHPSITSEKHCIATVWHNDEKRKAVEANAHLIAAAPELYAALQEIARHELHQRHTATEVNPSERYEHLNNLLGDCIGRARAALKKARGEP